MIVPWDGCLGCCLRSEFRVSCWLSVLRADRAPNSWLSGQCSVAYRSYEQIRDRASDLRVFLKTMLGPAEAGGESDFQEVKYGATRETEDGCRARSKQCSRENTSAYFHNALSFRAQRAPGQLIQC